MQVKRIHAICLNTAIDIRMVLPKFDIGSVVRSVDYSEFAAGKAVNSSITIAAIGGKVELYCLVGNSDVDLFSFSESNIIVTAFGLPGLTRKNLTLMDLEGKLICHIQNSGYSVAEPDLVKLEEKLITNVAQGDVVILSGTVPPGTPGAYLDRLIRNLHGQGAIVLLDVDPVLLKDIDATAVTLTKPNLQELGVLAGKKLVSEAMIVEAALSFIKSRYIVVSMGSEGALWIDSKSKLYTWGAMPGTIRAPFDPIGCGDAMVAGFAVGLAEEKGIDDIFKMGIGTGYANLFAEGPGRISVAHYSESLRLVKLEERSREQFGCVTVKA